MTSHKITKKISYQFQQGLYAWSKTHPRPMPWKGEKNPYKIWLSEIILQQTRVEQGLPYYERFIKTFPTVHRLAKAPLQKVLKLWEGLGYYTRARNLHASAQIVSNSYLGVFPATFEEIKQLKGIGDYTAAAIASFAFDLPYAVLDGNVQRVLARYFGLAQTMQSSAEKKLFQHYADALLDAAHSGKYNQAIMDFGAMCCLPKSPSCTICPLNKLCYAWQHKSVEAFPTAKKSMTKQTRFFHYFIFYSNDQVYIQQRSRGDVWADLYEFPLIETLSSAFPHASNIKMITSHQLNPKVADIEYVQILSHQVINAYFYCYGAKINKNKCVSIPLYHLPKYPMPGVISHNRVKILKLLNHLSYSS